MYKRLTAGILVAAGSLSIPTHAAVTVYKEGDKKIEIGGLIQIQYTSVDPDCPGAGPCYIDNSLGTSDGTEDRLFFRRLRPVIQGTATKNWSGKIELDLGESQDANEVQVKDAFLAYSGFQARSLKLTIGNAKPPFAREFLTSSSRQQLVERSFVGDHNFGSPDRAMGLKLEGLPMGKKLGWALGLHGADHDPAATRMDFDSPVNGEADFNQGWLVTARVDVHPRGEIKYDQGDFRTKEWKYTLSAGAFHWVNDDDNNTHTLPGGAIDCTEADPQKCKADLDQATGFEISGGVRGHGLSADIEVHRVSGDTVDPNFTGGLYGNGTTDLDMLAVEGGYMVMRERLEVAAGWDSLDADNYAARFERATMGLNYYWNEHNAKVSLNYRLVRNFLGLTDQDHRVVFLQTQFLF